MNKTSLFRQRCDIAAVPVQYRGNIRETRINPESYTSAYEEVQDITDSPLMVGLTRWLNNCAAIYAPNNKPHKTSRQTLTFYLARKEAKKTGKNVMDLLGDATKKAESFIKHWERCQVRNLPVTSRIVTYQPVASPVQEAIMALHSGKRDVVVEFLKCYLDAMGGEDDPAAQWAESIGEKLPNVKDFVEAEDIEDSEDAPSQGKLREDLVGLMSVVDPKERALSLMLTGLPFKETLEFLEQIEYKEMPKLPEYIHVSRFRLLEKNPEPVVVNAKNAMFPKGTIRDEAKVLSKKYLDDLRCKGSSIFLLPGTKVLKDEQGREYIMVLQAQPWFAQSTGGIQEVDADGVYVMDGFWDEDPEMDLAHSPAQDRVEERAVQAEFREREDELTKKMRELMNHPVIQQVKPNRDERHMLFMRMCEEARQQAMKTGRSVSVVVH